MYETDKPWPLKCFDCLHEFEETVGRLETNDAFRCPKCGILNEYNRKKFALKLAQARNGLYDPYSYMFWLKKPS